MNSPITPGATGSTVIANPFGDRSRRAHRYLDHREGWGESLLRAGKPGSGVLRLHGDLKSLGIDLILVPLPTKIGVYPDYFLPRMKGILKVDQARLNYIAYLRGKGLTVIDLKPEMVKQRDDLQYGPIYSIMDHHWAARGCMIGAKAVAAEIKKRPWAKQLPKARMQERWVQYAPQRRGFYNRTLQRLQTTTLVMNGKSMIPELKKKFWMREITGGNPTPKGKILVIGNSQVLAAEKSFAKQLAFETGTYVDLVYKSARVTGALKNFIQKATRDPAWLRNKKAVVLICGGRAADAGPPRPLPLRQMAMVK